MVGALLLKGRPQDSICEGKSRSSGAHLLTGLSHICGCTVNPVQFPFSVMLKIPPMPPIPMKVPLTMIRIRILPVLLLRFEAGYLVLALLDCEAAFEVGV